MVAKVKGKGKIEIRKFMGESQFDLSRKVVRTYGGFVDHTDEGRGVKSVEYQWGDVKEGNPKVESLDSLLFEQLEKAKAEGRDRVVVVDVGSGDGALIKDCVLGSSKIGKSLTFLKENPGLRLEMVGFTDAPNRESFLSEENFPSSAHNISGKNVYYTLTRRQRLGDFLKAEGIRGVDLVFATWSLTYMGPETFRGCIEDSVSNLRSGGKFWAVAYAERYLPGFVRLTAGFGPEPDVRNVDRHSQTSSFKATLKGGIGRFWVDGVNFDDEEMFIAKAEDKLVETGALKAEDVDRVRRNYEIERGDIDKDAAILRRISRMLSRIRYRWEKGTRGQDLFIQITGEDRDKALSVRYVRTVYHGMQELATMKAKKLKEIKKEILVKMKEGLSGRAELLFGENAILITKT